MPFAGYEINSRHTEPWVTAIGKFMVNFGSIEWQTFLWIDSLSDDNVLKEVVVDMPLSRRISVIRSLLEAQQMPKKLFNDARAAWGRVEKLAQLRNDIAHNPIVFGWHGPEQKRPPDFIGSLNFRKIKSGTTRTAPLLEFKALNAGIDEAVVVAERLNTLLPEVAPSPK